MHFEPGDRIRVIHIGSSFYGMEGKVITVFRQENRPDPEPSIHVEFDNIAQELVQTGEIMLTGQTHVFAPEALEKVRLLTAPAARRK